MNNPSDSAWAPGCSRRRSRIRRHEFKTPVTAIKGFAELLQVDSIPEEDRQEYLRIIEEESTRLSDLANSTLLLSKLESQHLVLEKQTYALDEQIKRCAILLSRKWDDKRIDFSADLPTLTYNGNEEIMRHGDYARTGKPNQRTNLGGWRTSVGNYG